jgi:hypothetical protein
MRYHPVLISTLRRALAQGFLPQVSQDLNKKNPVTIESMVTILYQGRRGEGSTDTYFYMINLAYSGAMSIVYPYYGSSLVIEMLFVSLWLPRLGCVRNLPCPSCLYSSILMTWRELLSEIRMLQIIEERKIDLSVPSTTYIYFRLHIFKRSTMYVVSSLKVLNPYEKSPIKQ